jgi:DNA-binding response OmpR family regulator
MGPAPTSTSGSAELKPRLLIVEDEMWIAMELSDTAVDDGWTVVLTTGSVIAATSCIAGREIDGALVDVNLNGVWATEIISMLDRDAIPFVIVTGYEREILPDALRGFPTIRKPCHPRRPLGQLAAILRKRGKRRP